jgi:hypothetical protein
MSRRPIPDERDQMEVPVRPDLRCKFHEEYYDLLHALLGRLMVLEQRVATLDERVKKCSDVDS